MEDMKGVYLLYFVSFFHIFHCKIAHLEKTSDQLPWARLYLQNLFSKTEFYLTSVSPDWYAIAALCIKTLASTIHVFKI